MARGRNTHRAQIYGDDGRRLVAVTRREGERIRRDREELMFKGMQQADSIGSRGPMRMSEMMALVGEYGRPTHGLRIRHGEAKGYVVASLIGNFAEHAREKFAAYTETHDTHAPTVTADGRFWRPNEKHAMRRAKRYAQGAKN